jgi:DNA segregation ATPase FtsK/SpoIIIE, S-DNA-T family
VATVAATRTSRAKKRAKKPVTRAAHASTKKRRAPARKAAPRRAAAAPPITERVGRTASVAMAGHHADAWGLALIAAGALVGLGVYVDVAGPLGRAVDAGVGGAVGMVKLVAPVALAAAGIAVLRGDEPADPDAGLQHRGARLALASILLLVASCGLLHLAGGEPTVEEGIDALGEAGGGLGLGVAAPLAAVAATPGAILVLLTLGIVGLVVLTHTSVRSAAGSAVWLGGAARDLGRRLFDAPGGGAGGSDAMAMPLSSAPLYDQDDDAGATPSRPRKKASPKASPAAVAVGDAEQLAIDLPPSAEGSPWKLPALSLLKRSEAQDVDRAAVEARGHKLESALAEHQVETRLAGMVVGPTVTRYELELAAGVKVKQLTSRDKDIAYAMATPDVRILAPIPGKQAIGVEVPNEVRQMVALGDILASNEARRASHPLEVAVGRDITGKAVLMNLATMPHILIAGQTGAGKSSCLNSLITSILMRSTPEQVRMILIDPKRVEMGQYQKLPHLLTEVVANPKKAANALAWAVKEMERRYDLLHEVGFRDITGYNAAHDRGELKSTPGVGEDHEGAHPEYPRLPFILVVVDELADLMMVAARDVEESICRLAQMARAVGIHLVIATQRPSVNVITGLIKANVPARLAFAVSSSTDSRVILDQMGAEKLVGKGDMLLLEGGTSIARRVQGCWVGEDEVRSVVAQWRRQAPTVTYADDVQGSEDDGAPTSMSGGGGNHDDDDDLLFQAMELVVRSQLGSTSMLQRKLKVGFARAGRLMDLLEQRGVVGPSEGSKARTVLMTTAELDELLDSR